MMNLRMLVLATVAIAAIANAEPVDLSKSPAFSLRWRFGLLGRCSDLATTRRARLQLSSVRQARSAKWRTRPPRARLSALARANSLAIAPTRRSLRARPKTVVNAVRLAPRHPPLAGKAGIGA
jgi:hypothetical protein